MKLYIIFLLSLIFINTINCISYSMAFSKGMWSNNFLLENSIKENKVNELNKSREQAKKMKIEGEDSIKKDELNQIHKEEEHKNEKNKDNNKKETPNKVDDNKKHKIKLYLN